MRWRRKPELVEWIRRVEVRPGDLLALKVNREITLEERVRLKEQISEVLPGVRAVIIMPGADLEIIARCDS